MAKQRRNGSALRVADSAEHQVHYAELKEVESFAQGLPDKYLECRELGHNWKPYTASSTGEGTWLRTLACNRCRTKREQEISDRGIVMKNQYIHPEGYLHAGMGRIVGDGRGLLRLESITRSVTKFELRDAAKEAKGA